MDVEAERPLRGAVRAKVEAFLQACGLEYDPGAHFTVVLTEDGEVAAAGSLDGAAIKCVAVAPQRREAFVQGIDHLMLFTKPQNLGLFRGLGFHPVVRTADCLLMESEKDGLARYLRGLERPAAKGTVGCIVANCNPFTLGHRYLVETAAAQCDALHLFIRGREALHDHRAAV